MGMDDTGKTSGNPTSYAFGEPEELAARDTNDMVLNARELLDDLGMHARALKGAALSARRLEDLEVRMYDLESDLQALVTRGKVKNMKKPKSDAYVCSKCDFTCNTTKELRDHKDAMGHHESVAPNARRRK
ncbi:hypothetical protein BKA70DRAFT_1440858 [Coprinopsis sp. MPI-PUGE-AT-0042]|nr:hypothetical protein BKA70DRAFT_1440858 [Coprinopsis sp. MPI-PUGE-AT-0042]